MTSTKMTFKYVTDIDYFYCLYKWECGLSSSTEGSVFYHIFQLFFFSQFLNNPIIMN